MCAGSGIWLARLVGPSVDAATPSTTTPRMIDAAVAAFESNESTNGAANRIADAPYSIRPCTKRGIGPSVSIADLYRLRKRLFPRRPARPAGGLGARTPRS